MWTEVLERLEGLGLQPEVTLGVSAGILVALGTFLVGRRILARRPDPFGLGLVAERDATGLWPAAPPRGGTPAARASRCPSPWPIRKERTSPSSPWSTTDRREGWASWPS